MGEGMRIPDRMEGAKDQRLRTDRYRTFPPKGARISSRALREYE